MQVPFSLTPALVHLLAAEGSLLSPTDLMSSHSMRPVLPIYDLGVVRGEASFLLVWLLLVWHMNLLSGFHKLACCWRHVELASIASVIVLRVCALSVDPK